MRNVTESVVKDAAHVVHELPRTSAKHSLTATPSSGSAAEPSRADPSARSRAARAETYRVDRRGPSEHATTRSGRAAGYAVFPKQTFGFFHHSLVMEYNHEMAVADGVNVNFRRDLLPDHHTNGGGRILSRSTNPMTSFHC